MNKEIHVLLVQSVQAHVELVRRAFASRSGRFRLTLANTLQEARNRLSAAAAHLPDLVITDWRLPDGQGIDLLDDAALHRCPVVIMTSHGNEQIAVQVIKAGASDYVVKSAEALADLPHIAERAWREWQHIKQRKQAEAGLRHLNAVLNAIRSINRLITRERDGKRLVQGACQQLVQTRGFYSAWIVLVDEKGQPSIGKTIITAQAGLDSDSSFLQEQLGLLSGDAADFPVCARQVLSQSDILVIQDPAETCALCALLSAQGDGARLIGRLAYAGRVYGVLAVSMPARLVADEQESELFHEIVQDIAFALYSIEQEQARKRSETRFLQAQKIQAMGRLAGGIAHDFNNHLTTITGYAELLLSELDPDDPRRQDVREITRAAERSAALTRQLLIFSRKQMPQMKTVDLNALIRGIERMLSWLVDARIELIIELDPQLGPIRADPGQIEQVVMNLVLNARDAMVDGGQVFIETMAVELDPQVRYLADTVYLPDAQYILGHDRPDSDRSSLRYVLLTVRDTGIGMGREVQSHLFEPFFTTKEVGKGTGLGLALVYNIVEQSKGYIQVASQVGQGSTFKILFPRIGIDAEAAGDDRLQSQLAPGTETILLVEDEKAVRTLARRILQRCGYTVLETVNADEAVALSDRYQGVIDLIVTDVVMPGRLNCREMTEYVTGSRPDVKVLYVSGYTDDAIVQHGILDSSPHFMPKPFTPITLAHTVREILDEVNGYER